MVPYENNLTLLKNNLQNSEPCFKTPLAVQSCSPTDFDSKHDSDQGIASF